MGGVEMGRNPAKIAYMAEFTPVNVSFFESVWLL